LARRLSRSASQGAFQTFDKNLFAAPERRTSVTGADIYFDKPFYIWRQRDDPRQGKRRVETVGDAISILFLSETSTFRRSAGGIQSPVWTAALYYLSTAQFDGTAASVGMARQAIQELADSAGILAIV
jgi:hypothetical protein